MRSRIPNVGALLALAFLASACGSSSTPLTSQSSTPRSLASALTACQALAQSDAIDITGDSSIVYFPGSAQLNGPDSTSCLYGDAGSSPEVGNGKAVFMQVATSPGAGTQVLQAFGAQHGVSAQAVAGIGDAAYAGSGPNGVAVLAFIKGAHVVYRAGSSSTRSAPDILSSIETVGRRISSHE